MALAKSWFSIHPTNGKVHTAAQFNAKYNHNYREKTPINANPEKEHLNEELIKLEEDSFQAAFKKKIKQMDYYNTHKVRKNAVRGVEFSLNIGTGELPEGFDLDVWKEKSVNWIKETFGDNAISAVLHMDETSPHIHCMVIPEVDGRLCAKEMFDYKHLEQYQESFAQVAKECGLDSRVKHSRAHYNDIALFYTAINDAAIEKLPTPAKGESVDDYFERAQLIFQKKIFQNLDVKRKMEKEIDEIKNNSLDETAEKIRMIQEAEELKKIMGNNVAEMKRKLQLVERINYALKECPDEKLVSESARNIEALVNWAKEQELDIEKEHVN